MKGNSRRLRGFEALAPTAQIFHALGKGFGWGLRTKTCRGAGVQGEAGY
jgi:hypothetical protein